MLLWIWVIDIFWPCLASRSTSPKISAVNVDVAPLCSTSLGGDSTSLLWLIFWERPCRWQFQTLQVANPLLCWFSAVGLASSARSHGGSRGGGSGMSPRECQQAKGVGNHCLLRQVIATALSDGSFVRHFKLICWGNNPQSKAFTFGIADLHVDVIRTAPVIP